MSIGGFIVGFYIGWELALIISATLIPMAVAGGLFGWSMTKYTQQTNAAYEESGG